MATAQPTYKYLVRPANSGDMKVVLEMIMELAQSRQLSELPEINEDKLSHAAGITGPKIIHLYILGRQTETDFTPIGYAICYYTYSTWQGKSYFLEEMYVREKYRRKGGGTRLFSEIATRAFENGCMRLDFHVLSSKDETRFFKKMAATDITLTSRWHLHRLHHADLKMWADKVKDRRLAFLDSL